MSALQQLMMAGKKDRVLIANTVYNNSGTIIIPPGVTSINIETRGSQGVPSGFLNSSYLAAFYVDGGGGMVNVGNIEGLPDSLPYYPPPNPMFATISGLNYYQYATNGSSDHYYSRTGDIVGIDRYFIYARNYGGGSQGATSTVTFDGVTLTWAGGWGSYPPLTFQTLTCSGAGGTLTYETGDAGYFHYDYYV